MDEAGKTAKRMFGRRRRRNDLALAKDERDALSMAASLRRLARQPKPAGRNEQAAMPPGHGCTMRGIVHLFMVPLARLERALLAELDFESSASTNSATGALRLRYLVRCRSGRNRPAPPALN